VLNPWSGFRFTILEMEFTFRPPNTSTISKSKALFGINYNKVYTDFGGWKNRIWVGVFGFGKEFILKQLIVLDVSEFEEDNEEIFL